MSKSEDYLDHLLKGVSGGGDDDLLDLSDDGSSGVMDVSDRENNSVDLLDPADDFTLQKEEQSISMGRSKSEDDFLKDFERELLDADDTDHFLEEFEKEMNRNETEPKPVAADKPMMDDIDGILNSAKSRMEEETPESNLGDMMVNTIDEPLDGGEFDQSLGDMLDGLGSLGMEGTSEMQEAEEKSAGAAEAAEETTAEDTLSQFTDDSDLMALLNEESDFSGLMESETQEAGNETGDTAADLGQFSDEGLESLLKEDSFDEMVEEPEAEEDTKKKKKGKKKKEKKVKEAKEKGAAEKQSLFDKLGKILFGEEEDEEPEKTGNTEADIANISAIEETSDESLALLKELGSEPSSSAPAEEDEKAKKKKEKEQKAKEKKEKKEQKAKEKKEKKEKEKAKKPKKEKKPKPPKEPDRTPPLPKGPVILIFVMAASILALVMLGTNLLGYSNAFAEAKDAYADKDYKTAFAAVSGMEIKESDLENYEKYRIMALVSSEYEAYDSMMNAEIYDMALDSLVRTVGRYEKYKEDAAVYGCLDDLNALEANAEETLLNTFGVSKDRAVELYSYSDREEYSRELYQILKEAGLEKVTEE